jgi:phosphate transport system permease protein
VRVAELVARTLISIGGVGTILAVTMICVFLGWVVVPIFLGADVDAHGVRPVDADGAPVAFAVDEYRTLGWTLFEDGRLVSYRLDDGQVLETRRLFESAAPTAVAYDPVEGSAMFGFADGSLRRARIGLLTTFAELDEVPAELARLAPDEVVRHAGGIAQRTGNSQVRFLELAATIDDPIETPSTTPIRLVDRISTSGGDVFCTLDAEGGLYAFRRREKKNLLTGKTTFTLTQGRIPYDDRSARGEPAYLLLSDAGAMVYVAWRDGSLERYLTRNLDEPRLVERVDLVPEQGEELTQLGMLLGRRTLMAGDARGRVRAWFLTRPEGAGTVDGSLLAAGHELGQDPDQGGGAAIQAKEILLKCDEE